MFLEILIPAISSGAGSVLPLISHLRPDRSPHFLVIAFALFLPFQILAGSELRDTKQFTIPFLLVAIIFVGYSFFQTVLYERTSSMSESEYTSRISADISYQVIVARILGILGPLFFLTILYDHYDVLSRLTSLAIISYILAISTISFFLFLARTGHCLTMSEKPPHYLQIGVIGLIAMIFMGLFGAQIKTDDDNVMYNCVNRYTADYTSSQLTEIAAIRGVHPTAVETTISVPGCKPELRIVRSDLFYLVDKKQELRYVDMSFVFYVFCVIFCIVSLVWWIVAVATAYRANLSETDVD